MIWIIAFPIFICAVSIFALIRNMWVYRVRTKILDEDHTAWRPGQYPYHPRYDALPEYDVMFLKFWIWDVRKFFDNSRAHVR